MTALSAFFYDLIWNCVTNYSNYYYYYYLQKKGLKLFVSYMWKKLCNLIARKFRKTRRFSLHDVWIVVFYFYILLFLLSSLLYIFSPHRTWNAHALAFSFCPLSVLVTMCPLDDVFVLLRVCFSSMLLSLHSKEPFSIVAHDDGNEWFLLLKHVLFPSLCKLLLSAFASSTVYLPTYYL